MLNCITVLSNDWTKKTATFEYQFMLFDKKYDSATEPDYQFNSDTALQFDYFERRPQVSK
jgi:hypothetical protein